MLLHLRSILVHFLSFSLFLLLLARAWGHVFVRSVYSILHGILVQIVYSATPLLFACLRGILHVRLCCSALCFFKYFVVHVVKAFLGLCEPASLGLFILDESAGTYVRIMYYYQGYLCYGGGIQLR